MRRRVLGLGWWMLVVIVSCVAAQVRTRSVHCSRHSALCMVPFWRMERSENVRLYAPTVSSYRDTPRVERAQAPIEPLFGPLFIFQHSHSALGAAPAQWKMITLVLHFFTGRWPIRTVVKPISVYISPNT